MNQKKNNKTATHENIIPVKGNQKPMNKAILKPIAIQDGAEQHNQH